MTVNQLINLLAGITLLEMMVTTGLSVKFADVLDVGKSWGLVARAAVANYVLVPAAAVGLLLLFNASPMVAAGLLIVAVCPGAPYGPPFTAMAKGNVVVSVGLMVILAGSSAIIAPLLLQVLLPLMAADTTLKINAAKMAGTLLGVQLLPLCVGLLIRHRKPALAERLKKPASQLTTILNLLLLSVILFVQFPILMDIRPRGYFGMLCLLLATLVSGWLVTWRASESRKGMMITTSVRNVGVGLVIATSSFPGTAAVTAATAYAIFQTLAMVLVALSWGRLTRPGFVSAKAKAA
jgi:bile acid:Na+ symporter, BASS family